MDIQNRLEDVAKLRNNVCQDFLRMILKPGWQQDLFSISKTAIENNDKFKFKYYNAYREMREYGIDNYCVEKMDVTTISNIIGYCKNLYSAEKITINAFRELKIDRDNISHLNKNEDIEELYLIGLLDLYKLKRFVRIVDENEIAIDDNIREQFHKKHVKEINSLMDILDDERITSIHQRKQIEKDIQYIISCNNPTKEWLRISGLYFDAMRSKRQEDEEKWQQFMICSFDNGITEATSFAFDILVQNNPIELSRRINAIDELTEEMESSLYSAISFVCDLDFENTVSERLKPVIQSLESKGYIVSRDSKGRYHFKKEKR